MLLQGQSLDRTADCYDDSASVVVQITDKCPCVSGSDGALNACNRDPGLLWSLEGRHINLYLKSLFLCMAPEVVFNYEKCL